jgi:CheY-like chemotaxis protein
MVLLIVDDIAVNRRLLKATLEAEGYTTLQAADGVEGLAILGREHVDGVISDILMPGMDGYRFCHEIRADERYASLPIVMYSSTYDSRADVDLAVRVGADQFVKKPAPTELLLKALQAAFARGPTAPVAERIDEPDVMKQYNEALVRKLEHKNTALQQAHDVIVVQNADLDRRVRERTEQLEQSNRELREAIAEVKALSGLLPICVSCKKIRDDRAYWHSLEEYFHSRANIKFSHGYCPGCYEKKILSLDKENDELDG